MLRAEFDKHEDLDPVAATKKLEETEAYSFDIHHFDPIKFPLSPGGVAYDREPVEPDWLFDAWAPLEKAQYPSYFARRDIRKREYMERYNKKYGSQPSTSDHH